MIRDLLAIHTRQQAFSILPARLLFIEADAGQPGHALSSMA
jgi:hypothetical protein